MGISSRKNGSRKGKGGQKGGGARGLDKDNVSFDLVPNRSLKFDVLNRRVIGAKRKSGVAKASQARVKLANEYKKRSKAGSFQDLRFGDTAARFSRERVKRSSRKDKYRLTDDAKDAAFTHGGKAIGKDYEDDGFDGFEDAEGENIGRDMTEMHFGGGSDDAAEDALREYQIYGGGGGGGGGGGSDLADLYGADDGLKEYKERKLERKKDKTEQVRVFDKADEDFDSLRSLLSFRGTRREGRGRDDEGRDDELDDYDALVRGVAFERKAKAGDRTKTEEEVRGLRLRLRSALLLLLLLLPQPRSQLTPPQTI